MFGIVDWWVCDSVALRVSGLSVWVCVFMRLRVCEGLLVCLFVFVCRVFRCSCMTVCECIYEFVGLFVFVR